MLGKIYTIAFVGFFVFALYYQREYLNRTSEEFKAQLSFENAVLPTNTAKNFNIKIFENGYLKTVLSGDKIVYFSNAHFEAKGNLVYEAFNKEKKITSKIATSEATGEINTTDNSSLMLNNASQLKYAELPGEVNFNLNENQGKTSAVYIDALNQTVQSNNYIKSQGPLGDVEGIGFYYSSENENFEIKKKVSGVVKKLPKIDK